MATPKLKPFHILDVESNTGADLISPSQKAASPKISYVVINELLISYQRKL